MMIRAVLYLFAITILSSAIVGQEKSGEAALAIGHADENLKWGSCPPLFPKGCEIAVLHGDPSKNDADVFLRVPGNYEIPLHRHSSSERMILVSGKMTVTYDGQPPTTLLPGTYAYGPPKLPHKAVCEKGGPCVLFIAFDLPVDAELVVNKPK